MHPAKQPRNRLKSIWAEERTALGVIATIPSVQTIQIMARSGLDFVIIDMEHGAIDAGTAHNMIAATSGTPLVPLVRVASKSAWHAKVPLDLGALGVCFPNTNTREDAQAAVRAIRYPPKGDRMWGPFYAPPRWDVSMREYLDRADDEVMAVGVIEHIDAAKTIHEWWRRRGLIFSSLARAFGDEHGVEGSCRSLGRPSGDEGAGRSYPAEPCPAWRSCHISGTNCGYDR